MSGSIWTTKRTFMITTTKKRMFDDIVALQPFWHNFGLDHPYETPYEMMRKLFSETSSLEAAPFYKWDHAPFFSKLAARAKALGVELFSCNKEGVLARAGVKYFDLEKILIERFKAAGQRGGQLVGSVDTINRDANHLSIGGWASYPQNPPTQLQVIAEFRGRVIGTATVDSNRSDISLQNSGADEIKNGFEFVLDKFDGDPNQIAFFVVARTGEYETHTEYLESWSKTFVD